MKRIMKQIISCTLALCIIVACGSSTVALAEKGNSKIDTKAVNSIIQQGDRYYRIDPNYELIEVTKIDVLSPEGMARSSVYASLREETMEIIDTIIENSEKTDDFELQSLEVYTDVLPEVMPRGRYVQNQQVMYKGVSNFQTWFTYDDYLKKLQSNTVKQTVIGVSGMMPYISYFTSPISTWLNFNISTGEWQNTTTQLSLHEEKVVQLSWVYNPGVEDVYLGAQTQFATVRAESLTRNVFQNSVSKLSPYVYFKTPNYQDPTNVALNGRIDTFVERLDNYEFAVNVNGRNETCYFTSLF